MQLFLTRGTSAFCHVLWECFILSQGDGAERVSGEGFQLAVMIGIGNNVYDENIKCILHAMTLCRSCIKSSFGKKQTGLHCQQMLLSRSPKMPKVTFHPKMTRKTYFAHRNAF